MQLYLVRHAEAVPGEPDDLRPLTPNGREQARRLAARLRQDGVRPAAVLTSPLLRARETGKLLAKELDSEVLVAEELAPGATADSVSRAVRGATSQADSVIAVGHQPDCGRIVAALTGQPEQPFPPASSVAISLP